MPRPSRGIKQVQLCTTDDISDTDPHLLWVMQSPPQKAFLVQTDMQDATETLDIPFLERSHSTRSCQQQQRGISQTLN